MWKQVKEEAALKTYMYTRTSGISRDGTKSVWDEYQKGLQKEFSASNKRWQQIGLSLSKCQLPVKNNVVVIDGGVSSEAPKAAGEIGYGASVEISGSSSLSTSLLIKLEITIILKLLANTTMWETLICLKVPWSSICLQIKQPVNTLPYLFFLLQLACD
jgi:hypothetical protein